MFNIGDVVEALTDTVLVNRGDIFTVTAVKTEFGHQDIMIDPLGMFWTEARNFKLVATMNATASPPTTPAQPNTYVFNVGDVVEAVQDTPILRKGYKYHIAQVGCHPASGDKMVTVRDSFGVLIPLMLNATDFALIKSATTPPIASQGGVAGPQSGIPVNASASPQTITLPTPPFSQATQQLTAQVTAIHNQFFGSDGLVFKVSGIAEPSDPNAPKCECGANFTTYPNDHMTYCPKFQNQGKE